MTILILITLLILQQHCHCLQCWHLLQYEYWWEYWYHNCSDINTGTEKSSYTINNDDTESNTETVHNTDTGNNSSTDYNTNTDITIYSNSDGTYSDTHTETKTVNIN